MNYFNLFSNILITKGAQRALFVDLQRDYSELFPLELSDIIDELKERSIEDTMQSYDPESQEFIKEYIEVLLEKELGFITKNDWDLNFPALSYDFNAPNEITNAFLEVNDLKILEKISQSLANLNTEHIVIYYSDYLSIENISFIESKFRNTPVTSIEILSKYSEVIDKDFFDSADIICSRIYKMVFYSSPKISLKLKDKFKFTVSFTDKYLTLNSCGRIDLKYFNVNLPKITEAVNHNSCLYKKIGIDMDGNIKNCPAMSECFGNIKNSTLEEALKKETFKKYWNVTKDKIEVCKDCEFRYVCTDCRAYTERTNFNSDRLDISKPLKCGYNPYKAEWEDWSKNPLKQKVIQSYGL